GITTFQFERDNFFAPPERAVPKRFFATTGISVDRATGKNESEDLTLSARNAALNMIDHLVRPPHQPTGRCAELPGVGVSSPRCFRRRRPGRRPERRPALEPAPGRDS